MKKYFKNLEHLNESLKETFGTSDMPSNDKDLPAWFKKCEAEGYGYFDSDGDFMFNTPLEDFACTINRGRDMTEIADVFINDDDDTTYEEDLKQTVLDMYPIYNESEILKLVVEFIAKEHCGGVN